MTKTGVLKPTVDPTRETRTQNGGEEEEVAAVVIVDGMLNGRLLTRSLLRNPVRRYSDGVLCPKTDRLASCIDGRNSVFIIDKTIGKIYSPKIIF